MKIVTSGNHAPDFARRCWESQRDYAERHGYEWVRIWQKEGHGIDDRYRVILEHADVEGWSDGELILWLDWDVLVAPGAPAILEQVVAGDAMHLVEWRVDMSDLMERGRIGDPPVPWYNIGVHLSPLGVLREIAAQLADPRIQQQVQRFRTVNQAIGFELGVNRSLCAAGIEVRRLAPEWHRIVLKSGVIEHDAYPEAHFIHFAGHAKYGGRRPYL